MFHIVRQSNERRDDLLQTASATRQIDSRKLLPLAQECASALIASQVSHFPEIGAHDLMDENSSLCV
jgi:hypothetical protein